MVDPRALPPGLEVPAKHVPVPETPSPQMRQLIGAPVRPGWDVLPTSDDEWREVVAAGAAATVKTLPDLIGRMKVKVEKTTIDGVRAFIVTPDSLPLKNRHRMLIHLHGGCYVFGPGEAGIREAVMMAGFGGFRVISVDYRMPTSAGGALTLAIVLRAKRQGIPVPATICRIRCSRRCMATWRDSRRRSSRVPCAVSIRRPRSGNAGGLRRDRRLLR